MRVLRSAWSAVSLSSFRVLALRSTVVLGKPEQGLSDGVVSNNFRIRRIRIEPLPNGNVVRVIALEPAEEQARRPHRQRVKVLNVLLVRPSILVLQIRKEKGRGSA